MRWGNAQHLASDSYMHACAFLCSFSQMMLQGSSCLCQIQMEVTTSTPHILMYVNRQPIFLLYLSVGLRVQKYGTIKFCSIVILHVSLTRHIKLFAHHKLFSRCFNVPPLTFRAIIRDLPTLPHKVNNAE